MILAARRRATRDSGQLAVCLEDESFAEPLCAGEFTYRVAAEIGRHLISTKLGLRASEMA